MSVVRIILKLQHVRKIKFFSTQAWNRAFFTCESRRENFAFRAYFVKVVRNIHFYPKTDEKWKTGEKWKTSEKWILLTCFKWEMAISHLFYVRNENFNCVLYDSKCPILSSTHTRKKGPVMPSLKKKKYGV